VAPEFKEHDAFQLLSSSAKSGSAALFKSGNLKESQKRETIVAVWQAVVSARAKKIDAPKFNIDDINLDFLSYIASLSVDVDNIKEVERILL
ncbi:hypothetical protein, partial [Vibrio parahaemolyticus]